MLIPGLVVLAVITLLYMGLGTWLSTLLLYGRRQPVMGTPADYHLAYEAVTFPSSDGLALKGWWIPAQAETAPVIILLHPLFGNRCGFSGSHPGWLPRFCADVDLLKMAREFHQAGFNGLVFDFRSHGESQAGLCGGGLAEDQDVVGAVDYAFSRVAAETPRVGVVGFGLGAAAAIAAIGRQKGGAEVIRVFNGDMEGGVGYIEMQPANIKKLCFLVAVQPASLGVLLRGYLRRAGLPLLSVLLVPWVDRLCRLRGGYPLDEAALLKYVREVRVPVLFVQPRGDTHAGDDEAQRLYEAAPQPKSIRWLDENLGSLDTYAWIGSHPEILIDFARGG